MPSLWKAVQFMRALGMAPYNYSPTQGFQSSRAWQAYSFFAALLPSGVMQFHDLVQEVSSPDGSDMTMVPQLAWASDACVVAVFFLLWWRRQCLLCGILNVELIQDVAPYLALVVLAVNIGTCLLNGFLPGALDDIETIKMFVTLGRCYWLVILTVDLCLFVFIVQCTGARFEMLDEKLRALLALRGRDRGAAQRTCLVNMLVRIRRDYMDATALSYRLGDCFGPLALATLLSDCWAVIHLVFTFIQPGLQNDTESVTKRLIFILGCIISRCSLVYVSNVATSKALRTVETIRAFRLEQWITEREEEELRVFTLQMHQRPVRFSLFGVATLDTNLLCTIGGAMMTCLIVLMQITQPALSDPKDASANLSIA